MISVPTLSRMNNGQKDHLLREGHLQRFFIFLAIILLLLTSSPAFATTSSDNITFQTTNQGMWGPEGR